MTSRLTAFAAVFAVLAAAALTFATAAYQDAAPSPSGAPVRVVQLERVVVVGKRLAPAASVAKSESSDPAARRWQ